MKHNKMKLDELNYWNTDTYSHANDMENVNDREQSIALSVSLLQKHKNISSLNRIRVRSHTVSSPKCQCHRSFHIFCTDLFDEKPLENDMINQHPAPYCHDRDLSRRIPTPYRKYRQRIVVETHQDKNLANESENQTQGKRTIRITSKALPRISSSTSSSNILPTEQSFHRSVHTPMKTSSPSKRPPKSTTSLPQLQIRALSIHDPYSTEPQVIIPRTPPPSPTTPTQELSMNSPNAIAPNSLKIISLTPQVRISNENKKESTNILTSAKILNYDDYAREYLSAVDPSDEIDIKDLDQRSTSPAKRQLSACTQPLSRSGTALSVRLLSHIANRYLNLQKNCNSSIDVDNNSTDKTRRIFKPQRRLRTFVNNNNNNNDGTTNATKSTVDSPLKSVFGFSKTASSMHFGYAADRLGLQGSFEKWPRPLSRRTPIERKHEVTTLRLVTLPLVTSR